MAIRSGKITWLIKRSVTLSAKTKPPSAQGVERESGSKDPSPISSSHKFQDLLGEYWSSISDGHIEKLTVRWKTICPP